MTTEPAQFSATLLLFFLTGDTRDGKCCP